MPDCPKGHPSVATDYCDECGAPIGGSPSPPPAAIPAQISEAPSESCPDCGTARDGRFCEVCGHDFLSVPGSVTGVPKTPAPPQQWRVVVTADREYHARMEAAATEDAERLAFPAYCPERRFELDGKEVLIGRRSRSRGIEPAIDLTGPPEDAGVSHAHALLVRAPEGTWTVVDLGSSNGTFVNDGADPIAAHQPVPLHDGDRIHVGAWTTLTLTCG